LLRHRRLRIRCPRLRSRPFAWSGRRRVDEAIRCRQLRANAFRRTTRPTPFQRRGYGPLSDLADLAEPSPNHGRPLTFPLSPAGTPDRPLCRPIRCPSRSFRRATEIHLRAGGLRFALPVKARRAGARERLLSYRELSSRSSRAGPLSYFLSCALIRVPFRLLSTRAPRQAVLSSLFPASALLRHEALRPPGGQDTRCV